MLTVSTCWMTTCLAMNSWTALWPPPSPGGRNQSVGHGRHFIPDVIGSGRVCDPHAISQFQQAPYEIVGPEEHLDPALRRPLLDGLVREECRLREAPV